MWPLDAEAAESRCTALDLWEVNNVSPEYKEKVSDEDKIVYWQHEVASLASNVENITVLIGILTFSDGQWWLRDSRNRIQCVAADHGRTLNEWQDRLVFIIRFTVHRETFTVDGNVLKKIYVAWNVEDMQATDFVLPPTVGAIEDCRVVDRNQIQFLLLNKSLPQMIRRTNPRGQTFGYLLSVSLLQPAPEESTGREKVKGSGATGEPSESIQPSPLCCLLFLKGSEFDWLYPKLIEGNVYQLNQSRVDLLARP